MATFGNTVEGGTNGTLSADFKQGTEFTAPANGTITSIKGLFWGAGVKTKAAVYASGFGVKLAESAEVVLPAAKAEVTWVVNLPITSGIGYVLSIIGDGIQNYRYDLGADDRGYNADAYADGLSDPFGGKTASTRVVTYWFEYTPDSSVSDIKRQTPIMKVM